MPERWVVLPEGADAASQAGFSQILAVHAALLHTGKVLYFGGSQHIYDATLHSVDDPRLDNTRLWDPHSGHVERAPSPVPLYDLFCCGHSFLADGKLLAGGGTSGYPPPDSDNHHAHYRGSRRASRYDPDASAAHPWIPTADLNIDPTHTHQGTVNPDRTTGGGGRWYPTLVALGDGSVAAFGGHPEEADTRHSNSSVEVFFQAAAGPGAWVPVSEEPDGALQAIGRMRIPEVYPRAHLLPNGRVFIACLADGQSYSWDSYPRSSTAQRGWERVAAFPAGVIGNPAAWNTIYFDTGRLDYNRTVFAWSTTLLPLVPDDGYTARVLLSGRAQPFVITLGRPDDHWPPVAQWQPTLPRDSSDPRLFMPSPVRPNIVDETEFPGRGFIDGQTRRNLRFTNLPGMRQQCLSIILPDATVLVLGGSTTHPSDWSGYFFDGVRLPEVYNPSQGSWRTIRAEAQVARVYHAVALLLPDGRVWTAGSNPFGDGNPIDRELRIELFEPWYFDQPRPEIVNAPASARHGGQFEVTTHEAGSIRRVALIRAASVTHGFVFDQRYVGLRFHQSTPDRLQVTAPPDYWIAPPGYYLLFITDERGVPSIGRFLQISLAWRPWFALGPNVFPDGAAVTAVSTIPGGTSLFVVGLDNEGRGGGRVWSNFFPREGRAEWSGWFPLGDNVFRPGAKITALSLSPGATSLYVMGLDGHVWSNFFPREGRAEWSGWFPLGTNIFPENSTVGAVSTTPEGTSLFVVGLDNEGRHGGRVWSNFFPHDGRAEWSGWFPLGENVFRPGTGIAALSLSPGATSLYLIGLDGRVWSNFFPHEGRAEWSGWFPLGANVFPGSATVTAVSTTPGGTSLFVVGLDNEGRGGGRVWSNFFPHDGRAEWSGWFPLGENVFRPGSRIAALSLSPGATSLYVMGLDGRAWSNFFPHEGRAEWSGWFPLGPSLFPDGATVTAVSTRPGGMSLFARARDGEVFSTFFDP